MGSDGAVENSGSDDDEQSDPAGPAGVDNLPEPLVEALRQQGVSPEIMQMTIRAFASSSYAGPLPPAEQIRAYEAVLPGSAERLFAMAERQQAHRHELENMTVREATNRSWWGLRLGFAVTVMVIGIGAAAIFTGAPLTGFALILGDLAVLAGVFVFGRIDQRRERTQKERETGEGSAPPGLEPSEFRTARS